MYIKVLSTCLLGIRIHILRMILNAVNVYISKHGITQPEHMRVESRNAGTKQAHAQEKS